MLQNKYAAIVGQFVLMAITSAIGIFVGRLLYKNVNQEKHQDKGKVIQRIVKTYIIIQCVSWPCMFTLSWLIELDTEVLNLLQPHLVHYVISTYRFLYTLIRCYIGFNSLIIAVCRYCFIVYEEKTSQFNFGRTRKVFIYGSLLIPLILLD